MKVMYKGKEIELDESKYEKDIDPKESIEDLEDTIEISDEELNQIKMSDNYE